MLEIVKDKELLSKNCSLCKSVAEGRQIGKDLIKVLNHLNRKQHVGIGLAAPQIGILKRVAVIMLDPKKPVLLINPRIIGASPLILPCSEGCLSFPGKVVKTYRHLWVKVATDNMPPFQTKNSPNQKIPETICYQHEIAHCHGLSIFDFQENKTWFQVLDSKMS